MKNGSHWGKKLAAFFRPPIKLSTLLNKPGQTHFSFIYNKQYLPVWSTFSVVSDTVSQF